MKLFSRLRRNKKGFKAMNLLPAIGIAIVVAGIVAGIGAYIVNELHDKVTGTSKGSNISKTVFKNSTDSIKEISTWIPIISIIAAAAIVLAIVLGAIAAAVLTKRGGL